MNWKRLYTKDVLIITALIVVGAVLAYVDNRLQLHTILVETVHALVVTTILAFCLYCQYKYPEIKQFGWNKIVVGVVFLMIGSWIDILDDPPMIALLEINDIPFGRSWQQAFIKKILGYTAGIGLMAFGFFQWIPWMIETRLNVQKLNQKLSLANINMNRLLMSLDEHIESERLSISRELHDDVAQQLTFLNYQLQLCQKEIEQGPEQAHDRLKGVGQQVSETLKSVRQISRNLRPESLYALGLVPALEQFIEKTRHQAQNTEIILNYLPLLDEDQRIRLEARLDERELLHIFRILQEGIRNTLKHSQATQVSVQIIEEEERFRFIIVDDGIGLPWDETPSDEALVQDGHLGIVGMKERVREMQGTFSLANQEDCGTRMEIVIEK